MKFTAHTARKAAEQITQGKPLEDIEREELSSLVAICEAELQDRERRERIGRVPEPSYLNGLVF